MYQQRDQTNKRRKKAKKSKKKKNSTNKTNERSNGELWRMCSSSRSPPPPSARPLVNASAALVRCRAGPAPSVENTPFGPAHFLASPWRPAPNRRYLSDRTILHFSLWPTPVPFTRVTDAASSATPVLH